MSTTYPQFTSTSFPDVFQALLEFKDVTASDATLLKNYQDAKLAGNNALAESYLIQIPDYANKILTADRMNQMVDTVQALEQLFGTDIETILNNKQAIWQAIIDQFSYFGNWSATTPYQKNNIVSHFDASRGQTYLYIATNSSTNFNPSTNPTRWQQLTIQGLRGSSGDQGSFHFNWEQNQQYTVNDIVVHDNAWWVATATNTNQEPTENNSYWNLVLSQTITKYLLVSSTPLSGVNPGDIYFQKVT